MHFSALLVAFVALFAIFTLASPAAYDGLSPRGTNTALDTTTTFNTTLAATTSWPPLCNVPGMSPCDSHAIASGIKYLRSLGGYCRDIPHDCMRVSCSYKSGIFVCNDRDRLNVIEWGKIADYAEGILNHCKWDNGFPLVTGQLFDTDGWNVVVRGAAC